MTCRSGVRSQPRRPATAGTTRHTRHIEVGVFSEDAVGYQAGRIFVSDVGTRFLNVRRMNFLSRVLCLANSDAAPRASAKSKRVTKLVYPEIRRRPVAL